MSNYRSIGELMAVCGLVMFFIPIYFEAYLMRLSAIVYASQLFLVTILRFFGILGLAMMISGLILNRPHRDVKIFLAKGGEPIHSGKVWRKGNESGLYLTTCEIVVSINQESAATGNAGYKIVPAEVATCSECSTKEGKTLLYSVAKRKGDL